MSRRNARKNAFFLLFQFDFTTPEEIQNTKDIFFQENQELNEEDKAFMLKEVEGVQAHLTEIDEAIAKAAKGWKIERMSKVDLAILRLSVYEMKYEEEIPVNIAINEAVELAKRYSSEEASSFINGILGALAKA